MFCALLTSRYQVSAYRTNGPLVAPYLENEWTEFDQFCMHIIIDKIYIGIVKHHILANLQQSYDP